VTGAPKIPTMRLIGELETTPRGIYCGAVGMVGPPGAPVRAQFNVAIRTVLVDRATDTAVYGTGGGITWASDPAGEYAELLAKANLLPGNERYPTDR
jgi:para-aminobenzoate synthetase / 4-amino-4-deoxychorismate lyase